MFNIIKRAKNYFLPPVMPPDKHTDKKLDKDICRNIDSIKLLFHNSSDLTVKNMSLKLNGARIHIAVLTMEGLVDKETLAASITNPISDYRNDNYSGEDLLQLLESDIITISDHTRTETLFDLSQKLMSGFACILVNGYSCAVAAGLQGFAFRGVEEPDTEAVAKGSKEGFAEPLRVNISLIRRRFKNPDLKFETMTIGSVSQTDVCICYLIGTVSEDILNEVRSRLKKVDLSTLFGSGYLTSYLEDKGSLLFSGVGTTERPDTACAKLSEGRILIIVDGTPNVLYVPHLMAENFQTFDDYTNRPYFAFGARLLKYISFILSVFLPGLYVATATFNPELFPGQLLTKTAESISQTPFSVFTEVFLFTGIYEIMREAGLRLPKTLGHAVSIIGGLVIGDTAVNSGFIGAPTLMIVALTVICSYVIPDLYAPVSILRTFFLMVGGIWGVWGIILLFCILLVELCSKESFGIPFTAPIAPFDLFCQRDVVFLADRKTLSHKDITVQEI